MVFSTVVMAFGLLLVLVACWFGLHLLANPPLKDADAVARVAGNCGDTMELALWFAGDRVCRARHWTDGCSVSNQCIEAAALLANSKNLEQIRRINMMHIMDITGRLPDSHLHCAQLAETTLQQAVRNYGQITASKSGHPASGHS